MLKISDRQWTDKYMEVELANMEGEWVEFRTRGNYILRSYVQPENTVIKYSTDTREGFKFLDKHMDVPGTERVDGGIQYQLVTIGCL